MAESLARLGSRREVVPEGNARGRVSVAARLRVARLGVALLCASLPVVGCVCEQGAKQEGAPRPRELAFFDFVRPPDVAAMNLWPVDNEAPKRKKRDLRTRQEGAKLVAAVDGRDPYFVWDFEDPLRAGALSVELESDTEGNVQLFWADDNCKTYEERCSTIVLIPTGASSVDFVLDPGRPLHGVRLDLPEAKGAELKVQRIRLFDRPRLSAGFRAREGHTEAQPTAEGLRISSKTPDPWLTFGTPWLEAEKAEAIEIELVAPAGAQPELFWTSAACANFDGSCHARLTPVGGKPGSYSARLADVSTWRGRVTGLRLDPGDSAGDYLLRSLTLVRRN